MKRLNLMKWSALAVVAMILAAFPYIVPSFFVNMATQMLFLGLFALSINLIAGYAGMVTLGQAGVLGIAGYGIAIAYTRLGLPLGVAAVIALVSTVLVAVFFGLLLIRATSVYLLMITLAQGMVVWGVAQRFTVLTGGDNGIRGISRPPFATEYWAYYYFALLVVAICVFLVYRIVRSPFGLAMKGIRDAETRMPAIGYDVRRVKLVAFVVSGTFAGVAGLLLSMYNNFFSPPSVYVKFSAEGLLMSILGGVGTITGAFVGSGIFVLITNYVSGFMDRWPMFLGGVFVLTILFAPDGLVGLWQRRVWARWVRRTGDVERAGSIETEVGAAGLLGVQRSPSAVDEDAEVQQPTREMEEVDPTT